MFFSHFKKDLLEIIKIRIETFSQITSSFLQVTRLACGGFTFAVRLNHTMSDAQGIAQFLNAVGEMARGKPTPTMHPAWARELLSARNPPSVKLDHGEYDTVPESQRTLFPADEQLVHKSFFFGPKDISTLKRKVPIPCTSFEVLVAFIWRARTIALCLDPDDELRFMFYINVRSKMGPNFPAGYYGNVLVHPVVLSSVKKLCESPLSYAVELIKKAKATAKYIKSVANLMALREWPPVAMNGVRRVYLVSDNTKAGYAEVDYGWGTAVYGGPATGGFDALPGLLSFFVAFTNEQGERGTVVPMCLPKAAMKNFIVEIEKFSQVPIMKPRKKIHAAL